jgi:predicted dehydrogenase
MSIHHYDAMRFLFGEIDAVSCRSWNVKDCRFVHHPSAHTMVAFQSGVMLSYRASFMSAGAPTPWGGVWTINGSDGEIAFAYRDDPGARGDWLELRPRGKPAETVELPTRRYQGRAAALAEFAEAVTGGAMPPYLPLGTDNIRSLAVVKACQMSAQNNGTWVRPAEVLARPEPRNAREDVA